MFSDPTLEIAENTGDGKLDISLIYINNDKYLLFSLKNEIT